MRSAPPQSPNHTQVMAPLPAVGGEGCAILQWRPELGRRGKDILERGRHHADNRIAVVVEPHLTTHDPAVPAKASSPEAVAENRNGRAAGAIVGLLKVASEDRRHA